MMKLQLALDGPLHQSMALLRKVHTYIDIVEIGTPQIFQEGIAAASAYREAFADLVLLADLKIMDAGEIEAEIAFAAGCNYVTVLGVASDATVRGAVQSARKHGGKVVADMIEVTDILQRSAELLDCGVDILCLHTAYDRQKAEKAPLAALEKVKKAYPQAKLAVAGGIGLDTIDAITALSPEIIIIGGAISTAADPLRIVREIRQRF